MAGEWYEGISKFEESDLLWRYATDSLNFDVEIPADYELVSVEATDNDGTKKLTEYSFGGYEVIPNGIVTLKVTVKPTSGKTTITNDGGAKLETTGDDSYYSKLDLVTEEIKTEEGTKAEGFVLAVLGEGAKAVAYEIHLEEAGVGEKPVKEGDTVTVTLPIPEGWDPSLVVVYHVAADGTMTNMNAVANGTTAVSFATNHFSTYVMALKSIQTEEGPNTGDVPAMWMWASVMLLCGAAVVVGNARRKAR